MILFYIATLSIIRLFLTVSAMVQVCRNYRDLISKIRSKKKVYVVRKNLRKLRKQAKWLLT